MEQLIALINGLWPVSPAVRAALQTILHREVFPRKHWLLQPGQISDRIYFIEQGVVRGYYLKSGGQDDGREATAPGWQLPTVPTWTIRVLAINLVQLIVVVVAGFTWEKWLSAYSVFHLSAWVGNAPGGIIAYVIATFLFYWWHRWRHTVDFLWTHFHQIHHSPQRLEVITSFYKHPLEMTVNSIIGSLLVYTLLGLNTEAGAIYTLCTALGEFFYHTNVKTPR